MEKRMNANSEAEERSFSLPAVRRGSGRVGCAAWGQWQRCPPGLQVCSALLREPPGTHSSGFPLAWGLQSCPRRVGVLFVGTAGSGWWLGWVRSFPTLMVPWCMAARRLGPAGSLVRDLVQASSVPQRSGLDGGHMNPVTAAEVEGFGSIWDLRESWENVRWLLVWAKPWLGTPRVCCFALLSEVFCIGHADVFKQMKNLRCFFGRAFYVTFSHCLDFKCILLLKKMQQGLSL